jgi:cytochrome b6-f complex iron-sulfur subunit
MAEENTPLDAAADAAKNAANSAAAGAKKAGSALAGLTGMKRVNAGGAAAPASKAPEAAPLAAADAAPAAKPITPGAGVKPVAPGAGVKPVAPGAGVKPVAPGAGVKPVAPGAGVKPAAPVAGAVAPVAKPVAPAAPTAGALPKAAPTAAVKKEEAAAFAPPGEVNRREFLNYVWAASIALFTAQFGGLTFFFSFPRFRPGQFGGKIATPVTEFPEVNQPPKANDVGKFWLVKTDAGVNVLYKICTHLGCIYPWSDASGIFACPCHGSQFKLDGTYIAGPAARSLDRFAFEIVDANGNALAKSTLDGVAVPMPSGATSIIVDTGSKITGKSNL